MTLSVISTGLLCLKKDGRWLDQMEQVTMKINIKHIVKYLNNITFRPSNPGKSTLLKALTKTGGETLTIRDGIVETKPKARVGYLEQKGVSGSTKTVREEVSSRMDRLTDAQIALEHAEKLVSAGDTSDEALKLLEDASIEFEQAGGFTVEQKISNVLKGLGFLMEEYSKRCNEFSGGWQMRIALARLLLSEPDILILDEVSNNFIYLYVNVYLLLYCSSKSCFYAYVYTNIADKSSG